MAKKPPTPADVRKLFDQLSEDDKRQFVKALPGRMVLLHPTVINALLSDLRIKKKLGEAYEKESQRARNPGKPDQKAEILRRCKSESDGQIALDLGISRDAVQAMRRRLGIKKK